MFVSHGEFVIELKADYLRVDACGPFNQEAVEHYAAQIEQLHAQLPARWGQLNVMHDNCLYTPQAQRVLNELTQRRVALGLCCLAFVIPGLNSKGFMHQQLEDSYANSAVEYAFFDDVVSAQQWLEQHLLTQ
ncbi:MAG: hypothetical protein ACPG4U_02150 [Pseudomonadales bacterium]